MARCRSTDEPPASHIRTIPGFAPASNAQFIVTAPSPRTDRRKVQVQRNLSTGAADRSVRTTPGCSRPVPASMSERRRRLRVLVPLAGDACLTGLGGAPLAASMVRVSVTPAARLARSRSARRVGPAARSRSPWHRDRPGALASAALAVALATGPARRHGYRARRLHPLPPFVIGARGGCVPHHRMLAAGARQTSRSAGSPNTRSVCSPIGALPISLAFFLSMMNSTSADGACY